MWFLKRIAKKEEEWKRSITPEKENNEWYARITTVSSKNHSDTAESSYKVKMPAVFPYMTCVPLADFLNQNVPCDQDGKEIKPGEAAHLIMDALSKQFETPEPMKYDVEKIFITNDGYWDIVCRILYNNQKYFFYFAETWHNKGYRMGTTAFEIDEIAYEQCKKESFDRNTLTKKIMDLPMGSWDWTKDNYFVEILLNIAH